MQCVNVCLDERDQRMHAPTRKNKFAARPKRAQSRRHRGQLFPSSVRTPPPLALVDLHTPLVRIYSAGAAGLAPRDAAPDVGCCGFREFTQNALAANIVMLRSFGQIATNTMRLILRCCRPAMLQILGVLSLAFLAHVCVPGAQGLRGVAPVLLLSTVDRVPRTAASQPVHLHQLLLQLRRRKLPIVICVMELRLLLGLQVVLPKRPELCHRTHIHQRCLLVGPDQHLCDWVHDRPGLKQRLLLVRHDFEQLLPGEPDHVLHRFACVAVVMVG